MSRPRPSLPPPLTRLDLFSSGGTGWSEFTRRRGGTQSTGVTDLGVFWDWGSMYMSSQDEGGKSARRRTEHEQRVFEEAVSNLHLLFAHKLTTVWMLGEACVHPPPHLRVSHILPARCCAMRARTSHGRA